ncbi:MAG: hypothetical protein M3O84_08850 [Actinomycetota bacterium]|nr:hypothetical protein [Actinomycetota bacterium]
MRGALRGSRQFIPEISPAGRWSAFATAGCLLVTGVAYVVASWDEFTCDPKFLPCGELAGRAGLISIVALFAAVIGAGIGLAVWHRPVTGNGHSGWTWSLAFLFPLGVAAAVTRLPSYTCPAGMHLDVLAQLCINRATRFDARSWLWLKRSLVLAALAVGFTLMPRPKWVVVTAPIAVLTWFFGFGWLLVDTVGHNVRM